MIDLTITFNPSSTPSLVLVAIFETGSAGWKTLRGGL
jgi:hypothetical protein